MMALTVTAINAAKSKDKPYKLTDGLGLYLLVKENGGAGSASGWARPG